VNRFTIKEIAGVPTKITGLINLFSDVIVELIINTYNKEGWQTTSKNNKVKDLRTGQVHIKTLSKTKREFNDSEITKLVLKNSGFSDEVDFISSDLFKQLPLWRPTVSITLVGVDSETYKNEIQNQATTAASFEIDLVSTKLSKLGKNEIMKNVGFTVQKLLPADYLEENGFDDKLKKEVLKTIKPTIAHELTHAYQIYNQLRGGSNVHFGKENLYNILSDLNLFKDLNIEQWDRFLYLVYLHLSFEINARISEFYHRVKEEDIKTKEEFFSFLKNSRVWEMVNDLESFSAEDFINSFGKQSYDVIKTLHLYDKGIDTSTPDTIIKSLVSLWFKTLEEVNDVYKNEYGVDFGLNKIPESIKTNPTKFFKFFEKKFKDRSEYMKKKLYRIVITL
jgi:hypothetical protein